METPTDSEQFGTEPPPSSFPVLCIPPTQPDTAGEITFISAVEVYQVF